MSKPRPADVLLLMYERVSEPIFLPKGDNKVLLNIPDEYYTSKYLAEKDELSSRFSTESESTFQIKKIAIPDLSIPMQLGRKDNFSLFIPSHLRMSSRLIEVFMGMRSTEDFLSLACYCRDRINPYMYIYALSVAILHRPDTRNLAVPNFAEVFPDKYVDRSVFKEAREESNLVAQGKRQPIIIPRDYTATDLEPEHRIAYFREDIGVNLHHWHWHLVYPHTAPRNIVAKDRRGELFYYMHQQIIARYNFERLSNNLARVKRLFNFNQPLREGYFPKLDTLVASRNWPGRPDNMVLSVMKAFNVI